MDNLIGHNQIPEIESLTSDLKVRADELLAAVERVPATLDQATVGRAADFVKQIGTHAKMIEERRSAAKQPYLEAGRVIDGAFKSIADPLTAAKKRVEAKIGDYQRKVADEERKRREEEARRAAEEAERAAAEAKTATDLETAIQREEEAKKAAEAALAKPAEMARTHGAMGAVATVRTTWEFEIENAADVPRQYCQPSDALIRMAVKGGERAIPGVRIYQRESTVVR